MAFFQRTQEDIVSNSLNLLSRDTNITQLSPGSKARFILDTVSQEQAHQHSLFDLNLMQAFIKHADGKFLDLFGDMLNNPRNEPTHASAEDDNVMFYVSSGTFGDINSGSDLTVPAGTTVQTVPNEGSVITPGIESQPVIKYKTTSSVVGSAAQSFVYAPVIALLEGRNSDVPRSVLNKHSLEAYLLSSQSLLRCRNRYSISSGEDRETDESYRYRLSQTFEARNLAIFAAVRLAALSVPGVSDVKDVMCEQGPGTYSLYVKSLTPTTSPRLLQEVATSCKTVTAHGIRPFVLAANPIGMEFMAAVSWHPRATQAIIAKGYRDMRNVLEIYLNNTNIGDEVEFSDLIQLLLQVSPYSLSVGSNRANQFEEVYAHRIGAGGTGTVRNRVIGNKIIPLYNERVILETSGSHRGIQFMTGSSA